MSESYVTEFERLLADGLEPVRAPESVWYRVEAILNQPVGRRKRLPHVAWAIGLLAAACLCAIWFLPRVPSTALAVHEEFLQHPERLDLVRCSPAQLHDWAAQSTGLAVKLAARPQPDPDRIEIVGARRLAGGRAAVFYRVGGYPVTLLIARGGEASLKQVRRRNLPRRNVTLFEWEAHGQAYTLVSAVPAGSLQACGLCHVSGKPAQG